MIIVKYLNIMSRTRMKATVITDGQYYRHFQIPFWAHEVLGLFDDVEYASSCWFGF